MWNLNSKSLHLCVLFQFRGEGTEEIDNPSGIEWFHWAGFGTIIDVYGEYIHGSVAEGSKIMFTLPHKLLSKEPRANESLRLPNFWCDFLWDSRVVARYSLALAMTPCPILRGCRLNGRAWRTLRCNAMRTECSFGCNRHKYQWACRSEQEWWVLRGVMDIFRKAGVSAGFSERFLSLVFVGFAPDSELTPLSSAAGSW